MTQCSFPSQAAQENGSSAADWVRTRVRGPPLSAGAPAAALKDESAVATARIQKQTVHSHPPPPISSGLCSLSHLSAVPSHKQQCVFNQRPIIHLHWFCSQQEKNRNWENCLYFKGSVFPISLLSAPSRPEPSGRHIMCLNAACVCVCESMGRCVCL